MMTDEVTRLRMELAEMTAERDALAAELAGDIPAATAWLQGKVTRQRRALDLMNRRAAAHRFALRLYAQARAPLTAAEWAAARQQVTDGQLAERIGEKVPAVV
jgi:hypothetical protein